MLLAVAIYTVESGLTPIPFDMDQHEAKKASTDTMRKIRIGMTSVLEIFMSL